MVSGDHGGEGMHYFVVDVVVTMLSWAATAIPSVSWVGLGHTHRR